jgi:hypothetical protein
MDNNGTTPRHHTLSLPAKDGSGGLGDIPASQAVTLRRTAQLEALLTLIRNEKTVCRLGSGISTAERN